MKQPAVVFPDVKAWAVSYLSAALGARAESYASGVSVRSRVPAETVADPWPVSGRLVTVRDDGGSRVGPVTRRTLLAVNVWADTEKNTADLAALVVALLEDAAGSGPVVAHDNTSGPVEVVEESTRPRRYASVDIIVRGSDL